ncbi:MAG: aminotransferase class V-fold PLP-dependent enzyme, partial [bacterium]|nr:aminotransferase class V-fold PLP-dependent enzyme [bacterium]
MAELAIMGGEPEVQENITAAWPQYDQGEKAAVMEVLESGAWYYGDKCRAFEEAFASFQSAKYGVACTGGTVALEAICRASGIGVGDEVITSAYTFIGTCAAILKAGATVVFADIDPTTNNLDPEEVEKRITPNTKAIMPVHFGGLACDLQRLLKIAEQNGLIVLEDACHGWGAQYQERGLGSWGVASGFSFQQSKNMTGGDGGIALTNDEAV